MIEIAGPSLFFFVAQALCRIKGCYRWLYGHPFPSTIDLPKGRFGNFPCIYSSAHSRRFACDLSRRRTAPGKYGHPIRIIGS
jgi:hypothetical protein